MAEDYELCTYEKHHKQKILLFLSSMRSHAESLKKDKFKLEYIKIEDKMDNEGISASLCNDLNKVHLDPQVIEQGSIVEIDHPELGKMRMPKPPANLKGQKEFPRTLAPILGFDNRQILEELKIENDIIERMEEREDQNRMLIKAMMEAQNQSQDD